LSEVISLFDRTVSWFVRVFTPPDSQVRTLSDLAAQSYENDGQVEQLRRFATNAHHLRLFYARLLDPAWLGPLYEAGLIGLPSPGQPWPVFALLSGLGVTASDRVTDLLSRLLDDVKNFPKSDRAAVRFEILRAAAQLGAAGHHVAAKVIRLDGSVRFVRVIGVSIARDADPSEPIITDVADAVLEIDPRGGRDWEVTAILELLEVGLTAENVEHRIRLLSAKVRRLASDPHMRMVVLDIAALRAEVKEVRDAVVVLAHYLVRLVTKARDLAVVTSQLLEWTRDIPGELGERVTCQVLANAADVPLQQKIDHVALRLRSPTTTGDDRDLVADVLLAGPAPEQFMTWTNAIGEPPAELHELGEEDPIPDDWARVWRWSAVLPADLLAPWQEAIRQVSARHGELQSQALDTRLDSFWVRSGRSPLSAEDLSALPVLEAAKLISEWRPDADSRWDLVSARALARALEVVVKQDLPGWTTDPTAIVTLLREPVYVLHYLHALTENAGELTERAPAILDAARTVRAARWEPAPIGDDDYDFEPGWEGVDVAIVDLIRALANQEGNLAENIAEAWQWVVELTETVLPQGELDDPLSGRDVLTSAISRPWGRGLEAAVALAGWEARHVGSIGPAFAEVLDEAVQTGGVVGMQFRAILALHRPRLEVLAPAWLDERAEVLFGDAQGQATFDLTVRWSNPTTWLLGRYRIKLFDAARRGAERAMQHILVGTLRGEAGYGIAEVIGELRGNVAALRVAAEDMTSLVQNADGGSGLLLIAVESWKALLRADRQVVPVDALNALGRWAFVTGIDDIQWLELMRQTLELSGGLIDYRIEVANRCKSDEPSGQNLAVLEQLLGSGDLWERNYVEGIALDVLRVAAQQRVQDEFWRLRTRLIELGRHDATEVMPPDDQTDS
jgi:hypothetical protein